MARDVKLTPPQAIVLGLLELFGEATPYELKKAAARTVGHFWTFHHAQLYGETERLAASGLLSEQRERHGRRRRRYALTARGRRALEAWRREPAPDVPELRDLGLLKLFFGADPKTLGEVQLAAHERKLQEYEEIRKRDRGGGPRGPWQTLAAGIGHERDMIRFWRRVAEGE